MPIHYVEDYEELTGKKPEPQPEPAVARETADHLQEHRKLKLRPRLRYLVWR